MAEINLLAMGMLQHGNQHSGDAAKPAATLVGKCIQRFHRVEGQQWHQRAGSIERGEDTQYAAASMEEGHCCAEACLWSGAEPMRNYRSIIQDAVVAQQRALGKARCARGVLQLRGVAWLHFSLTRTQRFIVDTGSQRDQFAEVCRL